MDTIFTMTTWKDGTVLAECLRTLLNVASVNGSFLHISFVLFICAEENQIELVDAGAIQVLLPLTGDESEVISRLAMATLVSSH